MKILVGLAASAAIATAGLGLATTANAAPAPTLPAPSYHWCPGEFWNPIWGFNWEGANATTTSTVTGMEMTMAATGAPTITGMTAAPIGDPIAVTTGTVKTP